MNEKFFPELARRLWQEGIATGPAEKDRLPVLLDGQEAMWVEPQGCIVLVAGATDDPKADQIYCTVRDCSFLVNEYTRAMASAPVLEAVGLHEEFRLLSEYNGVVLAGREMEENIMKNKKELVISAEAVELSHLRPDDPVCLHIGENTLVIVPQSMTAMEAVNTLNELDGIVSELLKTFREACGGCGDQAERDGCPAGCELPMDSRGRCPYKDIHGPQVTLSDSIRGEMGIAPDAKVDCFVDDGELVVTAADYEHDITDVPGNIRLMLSIAGVCPGRLDELLRDGEEVWHG